MIRQACRQGRRALPPSETKRATVFTLVQRYLLPQVYVRSPDIVEGLEENHPLLCMLSVSSLPWCFCLIHCPWPRSG